jgi:hypothetical protein
MLRLRFGLRPGPSRATGLRWPRACRRWLQTLLVLGGVWSSAHGAQADGSMQVRGRIVLRQGEPEPEFCARPGAECDALLVKRLSGYGYLRGHGLGALLLSEAGFTQHGPRLAGFGALHLEAVSADLPGGQLRVATIDGALAGRSLQRLRVTLFEAENLFVCNDQQSGRPVAPFLGMMTRNCRTDAWLALDLRVLAMQWDPVTNRLWAEWVAGGLAVELLRNGHGYAHLLRSISLGVPFDLRSLHFGELAESTDAKTGALGPGGFTSFGAGLRVSALYRSPSWETRLTARERSALVGGAGALHDHELEGELRLLRNVFVSDALVAQAGFAFDFGYAQRPLNAIGLFARPDSRWNGFAGLYLGWVDESPGI